MDTASADDKKPAIQRDTKSTVGAHNKNQQLTRVRGSTALATFVEVCMYLQTHTLLALDQMSRFVKAWWREKLPVVDQPLQKDAQAACLSMCFHALFEYREV